MAGLRSEGDLCKHHEGPLPSAMVYVILFGVGSSDLEGIYSLRSIQPGEDHLLMDTIVSFSARDDAYRYATLLEASMDHVPTVVPIAWGDLQDFCAASGYCSRVEPRDTLLIPPDCNVGVTDWERSVRLRRGLFEVLEEEPVRGGAGAAVDPGGMEAGRAAMEASFARSI